MQRTDVLLWHLLQLQREEEAYSYSGGGRAGHSVMVQSYLFYHHKLEQRHLPHQVPSPL